MVILRAFGALFAGFAVLTLLSLAATFLLKKHVPDWAGETGRLSAGLVFANLGSSFVTAGAGGYVTAWMSDNPLPYVLTLGIVVLVLAGLSALQQRERRPIAYLLVSVATFPLGVLVGGLVRLRALGGL